MNLFLVPPMSCNPIKLLMSNQTTLVDRFGVNKETVLYEPSEEAHGFIGHCLMIGSEIQFKSLAEPVEVSEQDKVYVMGHHYPDVCTTLQGRLIRLTDESTCIQCTHYHPCP